MIVKNEAAIIQRCLASLRPAVDCWVIVDTGSSDGTQALVRASLAGIPGELHERPWVDFGHNRTEALRLAEGKADYLLLMDADNLLEIKDPAWKQKLEADAYLVMQRFPSGFRFRHTRLLNARLTGGRRWRYWGVTHEYVGSCDPDLHPPCPCLDGIEILDLEDGASRAEKFARDRRLLEDDLKRLEAARSTREAGLLLPRTVFYLAQTYRDMGLWAEALAMYQRRAGLGGWPEEVWYSLLEVARMSERLQMPASTVTHRYLAAYQARPRRVEPLVDLARFHRVREEYALAHLFARQAVTLPLPDDALFINGAAYDWRALDEYAIACFWIGQAQESSSACRELLANRLLPGSERERVQRNLEFATQRLTA